MTNTVMKKLKEEVEKKGLKGRSDLGRQRGNAGRRLENKIQEVGSERKSDKKKSANLCSR